MYYGKKKCNFPESVVVYYLNCKECTYAGCFTDGHHYAYCSYCGNQKDVDNQPAYGTHNISTHTTGNCGTGVQYIEYCTRCLYGINQSLPAGHTPAWTGGEQIVYAEGILKSNGSYESLDWYNTKVDYRNANSSQKTNADNIAISALYQQLNTWLKAKKSYTGGAAITANNFTTWNADDEYTTDGNLRRVISTTEYVNGSTKYKVIARISQNLNPDNDKRNATGEYHFSSVEILKYTKRCKVCGQNL